MDELKNTAREYADEKGIHLSEKQLDKAVAKMEKNIQKAGKRLAKRLTKIQKKNPDLFAK